MNHRDLLLENPQSLALRLFYLNLIPQEFLFGVLQLCS